MTTIQSVRNVMDASSPGGRRRPVNSLSQFTLETGLSLFARVGHHRKDQSTFDSAAAAWQKEEQKMGEHATSCEHMLHEH